MRADGLVIAIDGPSGAGKSTVAHLLAERLGYLQIDTGAMYRAVAFLMQQEGIDPDDLAAVERLCSRIDIRLERTDGQQRVFANGQDVTAWIRTPEMSQLTSRISALRPVREAMMQAQRRMGARGGERVRDRALTSSEIARSGHAISSSRRVAMATYSAERSIPTYRRPSFFAAIHVVPEPTNGSSTMSPGSVNNSMNISTMLCG